MKKLFVLLIIGASLLFASCCSTSESTFYKEGYRYKVRYDNKNFYVKEIPTMDSLRCATFVDVQNCGDCGKEPYTITICGPFEYRTLNVETENKSNSKH